MPLNCSDDEFEALLHDIKTVSDTIPPDIFSNGRLRTISGRLTKATRYTLGEMADDK